MKAVHSIESNNNRNFTLLTDSKSAINVIDNLNSDHLIVSKIQAWIIQLHSRHKSIQLCCVPSHINIAGNERVDQLAKQAALFQNDLAYELYPYRDNYTIIKKSVVNKGQEK